MLSLNKQFKEAVDFAIINYGKVDVLYKCLYINESNFPIRKAVEHFRKRLSKYIPFKLFYHVSSKDDTIPSCCKFVFFFPSFSSEDFLYKTMCKEKNKTYNLLELIDKLWMETITDFHPISLFGPDSYISQNFIFVPSVDKLDLVIDKFDSFLANRESYKKHTDGILNLFLSSVDKFSKEKVDLLHYEFLIPDGINKEKFIFDFSKSLNNAFECDILITPDTKLRGSNVYELMITFPLFNGFNTSNLDIQHLIKAMWMRTLNRYDKSSLETLFLLQLNFAAYDIIGDVDKGTFSMGLYRLNRKVNIIYRTIIDSNYKNPIIKLFR